MQSRNAYILSSFVIPEGATTGARIEFDAENGEIRIYNAANQLVADITPTTGFTAYDPSIPSSSSLTDGILYVDSDTTLQNGLLQYDGNVETAQIHFNNAGIGLTSVSIAGIILDFATEFLYKSDGTGTTTGLENWTNVAFAANWVNHTEATQYKLFPDGCVRLKGSANYTLGVPAAGATVFTLPVRYRPPQQRLFTIPHWASATPARILILTTGVVQIYDAPNGFPAFDAISFSTI